MLTLERAAFAGGIRDCPGFRPVAQIEEELMMQLASVWGMWSERSVEPDGTLQVRGEDDINIFLGHVAVPLITTRRPSC